MGQHRVYIGWVEPDEEIFFLPPGLEEFQVGLPRSIFQGAVFFGQMFANAIRRKGAGESKNKNPQQQIQLVPDSHDLSSLRSQWRFGYGPAIKGNIRYTPS